MWLRKLAQSFFDTQYWSNQYRAKNPGYQPQFNVFQSSDFPHVFLGGEDDRQEAEQMAGQPICKVVDCRDLPEIDQAAWDYPEFLTVQREFDVKVKDLIQKISTTDCPIFVHCALGANRSVAVLASALTQLTGKPVNQVLSEMKQVRAFVGPQDPYYLMALQQSPSETPEHKQQVFDELDQDFPLIQPGLPTNTAHVSSWLIRVAQIPATNLPSQVWYHGTDASTAYSLMENMQLKPREETGNSAYVGGLSSIQSAVYLTDSPGKAAKHAIETAESYKSHPVILVIEPANLGYVHVDEDMVHMLLNGQSYFSNDWYPSPTLEQEIFRLAAESLRLDDYEENKSDKKLVLEYLYEKNQGWTDDYVEDEYLQEEGIVPDDQGNYEYDESMHLSKEIAAALNDNHQREAVMNFGSMAHEGRVQASEIYLIPWKLDRGDWQDSPTSLQSYDELRQFGTKVNPQQLLMSFMTGDQE